MYDDEHGVWMLQEYARAAKARAAEAGAAAGQHGSAAYDATAGAAGNAAQYAKDAAQYAKDAANVGPLQPLHVLCLPTFRACPCSCPTRPVTYQPRAGGRSSMLSMLITCPQMPQWLAAYCPGCWV